MPTVNIYYKNHSEEETVVKIYGAIDELQSFIAKELSCSSIFLSLSEISIRFIKVDYLSKMIGDIEIEVNAAAFPERVEKQDEFCRNLDKFLEQETGITNTKTWLILSELGHSM
ncbi:MAG: hypothetical protein Q7S53_02365 [bacterium]|nr:hypothetical protein [bacterium]